MSLNDELCKEFDSPTIVYRTSVICFIAIVEEREQFDVHHKYFDAWLTKWSQLEVNRWFPLLLADPFGVESAMGHPQPVLWIPMMGAPWFWILKGDVKGHFWNCEYLYFVGCWIHDTLPPVKHRSWEDTKYRKSHYKECLNRYCPYCPGIAS